MDHLIYLLSIVLLISGHALRVRRWGLLLEEEQKHKRSEQYLSLATGYFINFLLPLRVGEIVRALMFSFLTKKNIFSSLASVIVERTLDALVVFIILTPAIQLLNGESFYFPNLITYSILLAITISLILSSKFVISRRMMNSVFNIFNDNISFILRHFSWSFNEVLTRLFLSFKSFLLNTLLMWSFYLASFYYVTASLNLKFDNFYLFFLNNPFHSTLGIIIEQLSIIHIFMLCAYFLCPIVFIAIYQVAKNKFNFYPVKLVNWFTSTTLVIPNKEDLFATKEQYKLFLTRTFKTEVDIVSDFYQNGIGNDTILHRLFHGGSDALTSLISCNGNLYVRKYAKKNGMDKLKLQSAWLNENKLSLPLAQITQEYKHESFYTYDMPYSNQSIDFYEFIHSSAIDKSWNILLKVNNKLNEFHHSGMASHADKETIKKYVTEKAVSNFNKIVELATPIFRNDIVNINNNHINLQSISNWINDPNFHHKFKHTTVATIHGDLTIENIIINKELDNGWFIIDPNVGNIFETPLIDHAKLMQSLHFGYESLNRTILCLSKDDDFFITFYRSYQYSKLFENYKKWLIESFGDDYLREVFLHEIIHYLRLVPYKFRKDQNVGIAFTACALLLIQEYINTYEKD
ncbi:lysylphosphatidylglycerol synthase domain-containing protein [Pantoea allii]|uniref:lysylphosphatidylglycerol synthase domain-containing protein n=1 Tax=Pantoea allii TaxID=574096 RepID=UPI003D79DB55